MLVLRSAELELLDSTRPWFIRKAVRLRRNGGEDYRCLEICQGSPESIYPGIILVFTERGEHVKTFHDKVTAHVDDITVKFSSQMYYDESFLLDNYRIGIDHQNIKALLDKNIWIDAPDLNGDGFSDITATVGSNLTRIYSTHDDSFPLLFEISIKFLTPETEWPFSDWESGRIYLNYHSGEVTRIRIVAIPIRQQRMPEGYIRGIYDRRVPPQEIAAYTWNTEKGEFTGSKNGPNDMWTVSYPPLGVGDSAAQD